MIVPCGKGGVGKTAFTTMLSTALVVSGKAGKLLLIDADPAMGLPNTIGIRVEKTMGEVREAIIKAASTDAREAQAQVAKKIDYMILEALTENGNLALLAMGRWDSLGCYCSVNGILKDAFDVLSQKFDTILIDGEAGIEQINRQVMRRIKDLVTLSDSSHRGLQTVSFILDMVSRERGLHCDRVGLVINRVLGDQAELTEARASRLSNCQRIRPPCTPCATSSQSSLSLSWSQYHRPTEVNAILLSGVMRPKRYEGRLGAKLCLS